MSGRIQKAIAKVASMDTQTLTGMGVSKKARANFLETLKDARPMEIVKELARLKTVNNN